MTYLSSSQTIASSMASATRMNDVSIAGNLPFFAQIPPYYGLLHFRSA
jgi:hypothetical protein